MQGIILYIPPISALTANNMKDRLERLVLLPFSAGCISESSIPVVAVAPHSKRSNHPTPTPNSGCEQEGRLGDEESLSGQNLKTTLPRVQKMLKNFSQLFVYKDELEPEMGMEIGLPTDVKHVTHIGLDGCASSIFSNGWNDLARQELINLHSFPLSELELAIKAQAQTPNIRTLLQTNCHFNNNVIAQ